MTHMQMHFTPREIQLLRFAASFLSANLEEEDVEGLGSPLTSMGKIQYTEHNDVRLAIEREYVALAQRFSNAVQRLQYDAQGS